MKNRANPFLLVSMPFLLGSGPSWYDQREQMVVEQIIARGIKDTRVLAALRSVPRHEFLPEKLRHSSYENSPVPIGLEQTISQPYIVAFMTEQLDLQAAHTLFELGTGSGYQAAVASKLVKEVYSVEIHPELASRADSTLEELGYDNVHVRAGDGWAGWPEAAPFDRIIITAAADELPRTLLEQLRPGGKMIMPLGPENRTQYLVLVNKSATGEISLKQLMHVRFVPVTGDHE